MEHRTTNEFHSVEEAAEKATKWCAKHPGWQRICDIENSDVLYYTWDELPEKARSPWIDAYPADPEGAWREFGYGKCKVPTGHISGKGAFYKDILAVPLYHNSMMVFQTGKLNRPKRDEKVRCATCRFHDHDQRRTHRGRYPHFCTNLDARGNKSQYAGIGRYIPATEAKTSPVWCPRRKEEKQ